MLGWQKPQRLPLAVSLGGTIFSHDCFTPLLFCPVNMLFGAAGTLGWPT